MARFNTDNSTNAALAVMAAIEVFEKLSGHPLPLETKQTILEIFLGVGLWFTGKSSPATGKILKHLGLSNDLATIDSRDRATTLDRPAMGNFGDQRDCDGVIGLDARTLERMATDSDYSDRGPMPDPNARAAKYWERRPSDLPVAGRPAIDGTNISGPEFAARSMAGDEQSGVFKGQGEWSN